MACAAVDFSGNRQYDIPCRQCRVTVLACQAHERIGVDIASLVSGGDWNTVRRHPVICRLVLHRLRRVSLLIEASVAPPGFDLKDFARQGALDFGEGPMRQVRLLMTKEAAEHLRDTPLSDDQTIDPWTDDLDWVIVTATVRDSPRLKWWIRGFGEQARWLD